MNSLGQVSHNEIEPGVLNSGSSVLYFSVLATARNACSFFVVLTDITLTFI